MSSNWVAVSVLALLIVGCASAPPAVEAPLRAPIGRTSTPLSPVKLASQTSIVALLEPYLVPVEPQLPPPALGGRIQMSSPPVSPLTAPVPSTQTRPLPSVPSPGPKIAPVPKSSPNLIPVIVRLLSDERARSVEQAKQQLALASTRSVQTASEAKKTADLVRAGAIAQFKSTQADAAARDAVAQQSQAQKALDDALQRQRDTERDVQEAVASVSVVPMKLIQLDTTTAFRPVPFTYRLSILGKADLHSLKIEGGTLGRTLELQAGESGAWILRCVDPSKLKLEIFGTTATLMVRALPTPATTPPKA